MSGKHINVTDLKASVVRHKVLCVIMALALITLMIPSGLRAHAETADPQPQQEEQVQPQDEENTARGDTKDIVNPADEETVPANEEAVPAADKAQTEQSEEATQSDENRNITYMLKCLYGDRQRDNWATFYVNGVESTQITVSNNATFDYKFQFVTIIDGEKTYIITYDDLIDGYVPVSSTENPGAIKRQVGNSVLGLMIEDAPSVVYTLKGVSHAGSVNCKFFDNDTEIESFETNKKVTISPDKKSLFYTDYGLLHVVKAGESKGYTFQNWQVSEELNTCFEAFFKVDRGDFPINIHCTLDHPTRASVKTYLLDDTEEIHGPGTLTYSPKEPWVENGKLYFYDFNGSTHYLTVKEIEQYKPTYHYIFGYGTTEKGIEDSFDCGAHLVQGVELTGTVVEEDKNFPVGDAPVAFIAVNEGGNSNHVSATDDEGKFSFWVPKEATGNFVVSILGYQPKVINIAEPLQANKDLGTITITAQSLVKITVSPDNDDEHLCFAVVQKIGDIILSPEAAVTIETSLPSGTSYRVDENGIFTAKYDNVDYNIHLAAVLIPVATPGYEFEHFIKNGQDVIEPGGDYYISASDKELNLTVSYQKDQDAVEASLSADDMEEHYGFDYELYINDYVVDEGEDLPYLETELSTGTSIYLDYDGTLYTYNSLEDYDLEGGYEIIANPIWGYEVDYYDVYIDGVEDTLIPGSEITIPPFAREINGVVHYKESEYYPDVYLTVEPAVSEQHDGFNGATYIDDEITDYGEDVYGYEGPAYSHTELTVEEDGTVTSYHYIEDLDVTWGISIAPVAAEGYEFDYYEVGIDDEPIKLTPGIHEIPEVDEIYATINYKEVSPSPEPQPKPDKGDKSQAGKSPKTGDAMPFALVGGIAILAMASAGYILSRKFNK